MRYVFIITSLLFSLTVFSQDTLSKKDFVTGDKFLGIDFTENEIDSMYFFVRNSVGEINKMHKYHLGNEVPMSLAHSPILPGMVFNTKQEKVKWDIPKNIKDATKLNLKKLVLKDVLNLTKDEESGICNYLL